MEFMSFPKGPCARAIRAPGRGKSGVIAGVLAESSLCEYLDPAGS